MRETYDIELLKNENSDFADYYDKKDLNNPIRFLKSFNEINVFVGANNSGKSRFIRSLMNLQLKGLGNILNIFGKIDLYNNELKNFDFKIKVSSGSIHKLESSFGKERIERFKFNQNEDFFLSEINKIDEIDAIIKNIKHTKFIVQKTLVLFEYFEKHRYDNNMNSFLRSIYINGTYDNNLTFFNKAEHIKNIYRIISEIEEISKSYKIFNGKRIYLPTLRTAHSLFQFELKEDESSERTPKKIRQDIYLDTVRKNYKRLNESIEIFTGLSLYNEIVNVRNSIKEERIKFHDFETFLSINFFEEKEIDIVAKFNISDKGIDDDDLIQIYIGGKSRKLHNLGDGIQSLIILMYKIFLAEENSIVFIDEPELNLHPGYQRLFLEQITSNNVLTKKNLPT